jgi:hypothetical protein
MRIRYREHTLDLKLTRRALTLRARDSHAAPISVQVKAQTRLVESGSTHVFALAPANGRGAEMAQTAQPRTSGT